jgi:secreted Zn-dependent insulinase-like peptidase
LHQPPPPTHTHTHQHPKQASIAELHYSCKATELGIELHFHGLSQRLLALVELVLRRLLDFGPHLEEVRCRWVVLDI